MRKLTFIILLSFVPFWCGCIKYSYEAYQVKIIDAEENIPIEGADVSIGYMSKRPSPPSSRAVTDQRGLAELQVADGFNWFVHVSAEGYIPFDYMSFRDYLSRQDLIKQNDNERTVLIYKKPEPKIEIVVPDGYCGPVALDMIPVDKLIQVKPGRRYFSYKILPNGYVPVKASPLLQSTREVTARFENGTAIPSSPQDPEVAGFSRISGYTCKKVYFVGTKEQRDYFSHNVWTVRDSIKVGSPHNDLFDSYFRE